MALHRSLCFRTWIYAWATDDDISLLGLILSQVFGLFFIFGSAGYGHKAKQVVDERVRQTAGARAIRELVQRIIREGPDEMQTDIPAFTGPLWFALPNDDKPGGAKPKWGDLTRDRLKALADDDDGEAKSA